MMKNLRNLIQSMFLDWDNRIKPSLESLFIVRPDIQSGEMDKEELKRFVFRILSTQHISAIKINVFLNFIDDHTTTEFYEFIRSFK